MPKPFGLLQPPHEATSERGLAHAAQAVNENPGGPAAHRALHRQKRAIPTHEAVGVLLVANFLRQLGRLLGRGRLPGSGSKREVHGFLLVDHGHEPVLKREGAACAHAPGVLVHLLATAARGPGHVVRLEQPAVEGRQEPLGAAHVE